MNPRPPPREVLEACGLSPPYVVQRVGGTRNDNYRIRAADRTVFLRARHPDYCDEGWVRFDHLALAHLSGKGAPIHLPLVLPGRETFLRDAGRTYEAYPWIEGNAFPGTDEAIASVAAGLARFHRAGASFAGRFEKGGFQRGEMDPSRLLTNLRESEGISGEGDELADAYRNQVEIGASRLTADHYNALPSTLVHGDVQPANAIFSGSQLRVLVDYDWMSRQPVIYDLAYGIILFCGSRETPVDGADIWSLTSPFTFDEGVAGAFLRDYVEHGGDLPDGLRPAMMEQIRLTWAHVRIDGARKVPAIDRPRFLGRDASRPFEWIEDRRLGDWF